MSMRLIALMFASAASIAPAAFPADGYIQFHEKVDVERVVIDARAVDGRGRPLLGLVTGNFALKVDGKPVPLESATWVTGTPGEFVPAVEGDAAAAPPDGDVVVGGMPRGRLIVLFFQRDFDPSRLAGLLKMQERAVKLVEGLRPEDRVAVLTFDYHLKFWQDFTGDHERLRRVIKQSLFFGKFPSGQSVEEPSLAENFDFEAARKAAEPESALLLIGRALEPLRGPKTLLFIGWGMGHMSGSSVFSHSDYGPARRALLDARVTVHTLDVTDADSHTLEVGLEQVAADTGGLYAKTHLFPGLAMAKVEGAMAGHYMLTFEKPAFKRGPHRVEVKLQGIKGDVLAQTSYTD